MINFIKCCVFALLEYIEYIKYDFELTKLCWDSGNCRWYTACHPLQWRCRGKKRISASAHSRTSDLCRGKKACFWSTRLDLHVLFDVAKHRVERLVAWSVQTSLPKREVQTSPVLTFFPKKLRRVISDLVFFILSSLFFFHPLNTPSLQLQHPRCSFTWEP